MKFGSLFSGVGGFDLGFEQAGLESAWQVEIDKDCKRVLRRHWPNVELFDDVKTIGKLSDVDVLCGGFPCQDLSVAGKRKGLAGERSRLWFEFLRIAERNKPRWIVIENVPGLLSSDEGRDFAAILRGLVNVGYRIAWRVTDAQYFGVAQRRRRVFIVGSLGDGSCAEILFESEGMSGDSAPRREAGAGVTAATESRAYSDSGPGWWREGIGTLRAEGENRPSRPSNVIAATLDQRGRGPTDSVMMNYVLQHAQVGRDDAAGPQGKGWQEEIAFTVDSRPTADIVAFSSKDHGADAGNISPTLRSQNFKDSHINGGGQVAIAFAQNTRDEVRIQGDGQISGALANQPGMKQQTYIAYHENKSGQLSEADVLGLRSGASHSYQGVGGNFGVRRLTPRECERLQGFPDDWTRYDSEGKEISDSARYRMLGNAVAVPNARWLGKRILASAGGVGSGPKR